MAGRLRESPAPGRFRKSPVQARLYADVVLPLPMDHPFTYRIPNSLKSRIAVGMRALVPVKKRVETGYVVAVSETTEVSPGSAEAGTPNYRVRSLIDLPDAAPIFSPDGLSMS